MSLLSLNIINENDYACGSVNVRFLIFIKVAANAYRIFAFFRLARPDCAKPVGVGGNWHGLAVYETPISAPPPPPCCKPRLIMIKIRLNILMALRSRVLSMHNYNVQTLVYYGIYNLL